MSDFPAAPGPRSRIEMPAGERREIPLFPLNIVLFPGMPLPLHIFEPRYLEMVQSCLMHDRIFGVSLITEGDDVGGVAQVWPVGTCARIEQVERLPNGRLNIAARGTERFRILERLPDAPYPRAVVALLGEQPGAEVEQRLIEDTQQWLLKYLDILSVRSGLDWGEIHLPEDPEQLGYVVGALLPCSLAEKQRILQAASTTARLAAEIPLLRDEVERNGEQKQSRVRPYEPTREPSRN